MAAGDRPDYVTGRRGKRRVHSLLPAYKAGVTIVAEETGQRVEYRRDSNTGFVSRHPWLDAAGNRYSSYECTAVTD